MFVTKQQFVDTVIRMQRFWPEYLRNNSWRLEDMSEIVERAGFVLLDKEALLEKVERLGRLLENRPPVMDYLSDANTVEQNRQLREWIEELVGEFEGLALSLRKTFIRKGE